jgi:hypothetical protein
MPRTIRLLDDTIVDWPRPIETAPATRAVRNYSGNKYLIFIDETFRDFFGLKNPNGYLCYAAVGIPEKEYEILKRSMAKIFQDYEAVAVGDSGLTLSEFKFEDFRRIMPEERRNFVARISKSVKMHGGFAVGFFIHVRGLVMERVRVNVLGEAVEVPDDHSELYQVAASELRRQLEGTAQSETIARILRNPLLGMAHFLEFFNCPFQVFCDPRESKEDKAVQAATEKFIRGHFARAAPKEASLYLGMDNSRPSHTEVGLQLADLMAGEIRLFFEEHPAMLTSGATHKLITGSSREPAEWWEEPLGILQKLGSVTPMPQELKDACRETKGASCLPLYRHLFASGLLTCYRDLGNPRHIEIIENNFFDQTD